MAQQFRLVNYCNLPRCMDRNGPYPYALLAIPHVCQSVPLNDVAVLIGSVSLNFYPNLQSGTEIEGTYHI